MKLNRLESTTLRPPPDSLARAKNAGAERIRRVGALEGVEGERQRSLQQELAEIEPAAIGPFSGAELVLQDARDVAAELAALGAAADDLIMPAKLSPVLSHIDDSV